MNRSIKLSLLLSTCLVATNIMLASTLSDKLEKAAKSAIAVTKEIPNVVTTTKTFINSIKSTVGQLKQKGGNPSDQVLLISKLVSDLNVLLESLVGSPKSDPFTHTYNGVLLPITDILDPIKPEIAKKFRIILGNISTVLGLVDEVPALAKSISDILKAFGK